MKKFKIFYITDSNFEYSMVIETENTIEEIMDELAELKWYYLEKRSGSAMLNKDHVKRILINELKEENA